MLWYDAGMMHGSCGEMEFDEGFKQDSIIEQLGKIIDSSRIDPKKDKIKNFKPLTKVVTDDGDKITVTAAEATLIRDRVLNIPTRDRLDALKQLQTTDGLNSLLKYIRMGGR